jgi:hypothetical protein
VSDTNEKWRNVKLIKSLISTDRTLTVLIESRGLFEGRILSTRGKRLVAHVANMGERCVEVLVVKPEGKRPLGTSRHRWENNT